MPDPADIPAGYYIPTPINNKIANAPAMGMGAGYGASVTQGTSKTTGVTINARTGVITMHNAALAAATSVQFTVTNSFISATDVVSVTVGTGGTAGAYQAHCISVGAGTSVFRVTNVSAGSLSEAVTINFIAMDAVAA